MIERTDFQQKLGSQQLIHPLNGSPIEILKAGKNYYAKLFVSDNQVYAASKDDGSEVIGIIIIKNAEQVGVILPTHKIKVVERKAYSAVGEIV